MSREYQKTRCYNKPKPAVSLKYNNRLVMTYLALGAGPGFKTCLFLPSVCPVRAFYTVLCVFYRTDHKTRTAAILARMTLKNLS